MTLPCPYLNAEKLECQASHTSKSGIYKSIYVKLTPSEVEKCKTIYESCPVFSYYRSIDLMFGKDWREREKLGIKVVELEEEKRR